MAPDMNNPKTVCVCSTGLQGSLKQEIKAAAEQNGWDFVGALTSSVTHLVAERRSSEKYRVSGLAALTNDSGEINVDRFAIVMCRRRP